MTAREFLIDYFEIEPEYTDQDSIGNFAAVEVYIANSLYDDISGGNIQELLDIMEIYANYKIVHAAKQININFMCPLTSQQKFELQKEYCKVNGLPLFSALRCYSCWKDIYEYITEEKAKTTLITGCPCCNHSFVD